MKFTKGDREALAIVVGGLATLYAGVMATLLLVRDKVPLLAVLMIAALVWREYVHAEMRRELGRLRQK
jgi:hypothetical protein